MVSFQVEHLGNKAILAHNVAKAFDRIEWDFLWHCLEKFRFRPQVISWIQLLYAAPIARVKVNGHVSVPFALKRGTRQGCPLSPLHFSLALEPLAADICQSSNIIGFCRPLGEDKIALYANDMLLFLGDTLGLIY